MKLENYLSYLKQTALTIPNKTQKYLIKNFINKELTYQECPKQFANYLEKSDEVKHIYEHWEFIKDYKYSVLFNCDNFEQLWSKTSSISSIKNNQYEHNYTYKFNDYESFQTPIKYDSGTYRFLKFNLAFSAIHPQTGEELLLKYPFIIVIHQKLKVIEFRFDVLKRAFIDGKNYENTIYANLVEFALKYVQEKFEIELSSLSLDFMINECKQQNSEVKLIAQYMKLPTGGNAELNVGNNQEYILPFIGELKNLMIEHNSELETVPTFKDALNQFMFEMEEMSDYPWIEVLWENDIKTRSIHVKFIFNYMNKDYCLLQHYSSNTLVGMERMNYVVQYIIEHRNSASETIKHQ